MVWPTSGAFPASWATAVCTVYPAHTPLPPRTGLLLGPCFLHRGHDEQKSLRNGRQRHPSSPFCQVFVLQQDISNNVNHLCGLHRTVVLAFRSKTLPLTLKAISFRTVPCLGTKRSRLGSVTELFVFCVFLCGWEHCLGLTSVCSTGKYSVLVMTYN